MTTKRWQSTAGAVLLLCAVGAACNRGRSANEFLERGDRFAAEQKYAEAIVEYRNAIQRNPKLGLAHAHLADAYVKTNDVQLLRNALREYVLAADLLPGDIEVQLNASKFLLLARRYEDARTRAESVLAKDPKNTTALILKGDAAAGLKDIDGALEDINEAIRVNPGDARLYAALGALEMGQGRRTEAEAAFQRAIEAEPKSVQPQIALATFYLSTGRLAEAEAPLKRAVELDPTSATAQRALAMFYLAAGRMEEAEAPLRAMADKKDVRSRLLLADYYLRRGRVDEAVGLLQTLTSEKDGFAPATLRLAEYDRSQHRTADADRRVESVLAKEPTNANALVLKSRFLLADGKVDEALATAKPAAQGDNGSVDAKFLVGVLQVQKGDIDDAIASFTEVTKRNPRIVSAAVQLAQLHLQKGAVPTALEFAEQAVRAAPTDGAAQLVLVRALAAHGDGSRAREAMQKLLAQRPEVPVVHLQAAQLALQQKDSVVARREFTRTLELAPASLEGLRGIITVDLAEKKAEHARLVVDEGLKHAPRDAGMHLLAADVYGATGDAVRQEALLRQAIDIDAGSVDAFARLAALYVRQGKLDQAKAEYERIAKERPKSVAAPTMIGVILEAQNKPADAQKVYEAVVAAQPEAGLASNNLAWLYTQRGGNLDVALQLAQTAKRSLPNRPEVDDTLGWIYYKKDLPRLAIPPFEASVRARPTNATYQFHLGLAYGKIDDYDRALKALDAALRQQPNFQEARAARQAISQGRQP